jgi:hypothetical protein
MPSSRNPTTKTNAKPSVMSIVFALILCEKVDPKTEDIYIKEQHAAGN